MSPVDMPESEAVFAPLHGKGRTVRQALAEVAVAWSRAPLADAAARTSLEDAVAHLLRRARVRREADVLPGDPVVLAARFVAGLVAGEGARALSHVVPGRGTG